MLLYPLLSNLLRMFKFRAWEGIVFFFSAIIHIKELGSLPENELCKQTTQLKFVLWKLANFTLVTSNFFVLTKTRSFRLVYDLLFFPQRSSQIINFLFVESKLVTCLKQRDYQPAIISRESNNLKFPRFPALKILIVVPKGFQYFL